MDIQRFAGQGLGRGDLVAPHVFLLNEQGFTKSDGVFIKDNSELNVIINAIDEDSVEVSARLTGP